jgi:hypothetical protein
MLTLSLIICIIGGTAYLATGMSGKYPDIGELGRLSFWVGLLAFLLK